MEKEDESFQFHKKFDIFLVILKLSCLEANIKNKKI